MKVVLVVPVPIHQVALVKTLLVVPVLIRLVVQIIVHLIVHLVVQTTEQQH